LLPEHFKAAAEKHDVKVNLRFQVNGLVDLLMFQRRDMTTVTTLLVLLLASTLGIMLNTYITETSTYLNNGILVAHANFKFLNGQSPFQL
jgi:hypothetical protein